MICGDSMKDLKVLLFFFAVTFLFSSVSSFAYHTHTFIDIKIPAFAKKYISDVEITKTDTSYQLIKTMDTMDVVTGKPHAVEERVLICIENSSKDCAGENNWITATIGKEETLKGSNGKGDYRLNLKTAGTQIYKTSYWGT